MLRLAPIERTLVRLINTLIRDSQHKEALDLLNWMQSNCDALFIRNYCIQSNRGYSLRRYKDN